MRKLLGWAISTAFLIGSAASIACGGDDDATPAPARPAIRWSPYAVKMLGIDSNPKPAPKAPAKSKKDAAKPVESAAKPPAARPEPTSARSPEEAAFLRRLEACDKLTEIAMRNNDPALLHRAEEINQRVWASYNQKIGQAPEEKNTFESDQAAIERLLGPGSTNSVSTGTPDRASRAALKEGNP
jgi:hypothetical protein